AEVSDCRVGNSECGRYLRCAQDHRACLRNQGKRNRKYVGRGSDFVLLVFCFGDGAPLGRTMDCAERSPVGLWCGSSYLGIRHAFQIRARRPSYWTRSTSSSRRTRICRTRWTRSRISSHRPMIPTTLMTLTTTRTDAGPEAQGRADYR